MAGRRAQIIEELQKDILRLEGHKSLCNAGVDAGLGPLIHSFQNSTFPLGTLHEFIVGRQEEAAAASGFIAGLLSNLMGNGGTSIWISASRTLFPPALPSFGIQPDRMIFIDLPRNKDVLWAMEEALKCEVLTAVVGELREISFTESRRLQLVMEKSKVTGFILRDCRKLNTTACASRWVITPKASVPISTEGEGNVDHLPGLGFPQWKVELLKIKNGRPGAWDIMWAEGKFQIANQDPVVTFQKEKRAV